MADFEVEVCRILLEHGCFIVRRGKGDHSIWESPINGHRFVVDGKIKSRHSANAIMKQAGVDYRFR